MLFTSRIFLSFVYQPTNALKKTQFTTNIIPLRVPAPGCDPQGVLQIKRIYNTARHDTLHTLHLDEISSDRKDRDRRLYAQCTENINSW
jgi:hypothetical protein